MQTNATASRLLIATLLLLVGCGKSQPAVEVSPRQMFDEFAAALTGFKAGLSSEEPLVSEDVIAGVGELRGGLNQLIELCAGRAELQPDLISIQETLNQLQKQTESQIDRAQIQQAIAKLEQQSASLRQKLAPN